MDKKQFSAAIQSEAKLLGEAAKQVFQKSPVGVKEGFRQASIAFKGETTTTKLAVVGGISSGVTLALTGLRNIRNGLSKDARGKRDLTLAAVGAAELVGGGFVSTLFYERLKVAGGISGDKTPGR